MNSLAKTKSCNNELSVDQPSLRGWDGPAFRFLVCDVMTGFAPPPLDVATYRKRRLVLPLNNCLQPGYEKTSFRFTLTVRLAASLE